jgi:hypothetical protein
MAVVYSNSVKDARMNVVLAAIDAQTNPGTLEICTAAYGQVLAVLTLAKPSFSEAAQALTLLGVPLTNPSAAAGGAAALAQIKDGSGTVVVSGLVVGVGTGEIQLVSTAIVVGQAVQITGGTLQHS